MDLQQIIEKFEARNKSRLKTIETEERTEIRLILLNLYNETLEIIENLKQIK